MLALSDRRVRLGVKFRKDVDDDGKLCVLIRMSRGEIDLSILFGPVSKWPSMEWTDSVKGMLVEDLLVEELVLVGSSCSDLDPEHPVEYEFLERIPLVLSSHRIQPSDLRQKIERMSKISKSRVRHILSDSFQLTKDYVEAGLAYATLPYSAITHEVENGRMKYAPIINPSITRNLLIVTNNNCLNLRAALILKDIILQELAALVANGKWSAQLLYIPN